MLARLSLLIGLVALILAAGTAAASTGTVPVAKSTAFGVLVKTPDQDPISSGFVEAPDGAEAAAERWTNETGSVVIGLHESRAWAETSERADAIGSGIVEDVSLFGGAIAVETIEVRASAGANSTRANGNSGLSKLTGVTVLGQAIDPEANTRIELGDWGYAVLLEQAVIRDFGKSTGFEASVTGVHVYLTRDHGGLPAGSEVLVGYSRARAVVKSVKAPTKTDSGGTEKAGSTETKEAEPAEESSPPDSVLETPADVRPSLTAEGFVFPVYGASSYTDDFAAARDSTGWHHGTDIFAPTGVPVLAVTDGELFKVGWNSLGGHRLWLRDDSGNEYYYAHLSAYSPLAFDGARVSAGDVIAFVGKTGEAKTTPAHLHFEIHPEALLSLGYDGVVNPYEFLQSWEKVIDASFDPYGDLPPGPAPLPGAILVESQDIATSEDLELSEPVPSE